MRRIRRAALAHAGGGACIYVLFFGFEVELVDEVLGEGHVAAAFGFGVDGLALLGEALEIARSDLQAVEHGGGGFAFGVDCGDDGGALQAARAAAAQPAS